MFPTGVRVALVVVAAGIAYSQTQTEVTFEPIIRFGLGLGSVVVAALLGFQQAVKRAVARRP